MVGLVRITLRLLADILQLAVSMLRPARALATENLVFRRQLALYRERGIKPRRVDRRAPRNNSSLAPGGISAALAMEVSARPPADPDRAAPADPAHGHGKPALGRGENRQRATRQAPASGVSPHRSEVHAEETARTAAGRSALVEFSTKPSERDSCLRFSPGGHRYV